MTGVNDYAKGRGIDVHYLHEEARDPDFEGEAALCDWMADREAPRQATLSSAVRDEVTCWECLTLLQSEH